MTNGRGSRILPILAAVLVFTALAVVATLLFFRIPDEMVFEESLISARFALQEGSSSLAKRELLRSSRHAVSAQNWRDLLNAAAGTISETPVPADYRLFTTLAGRASASVPGNVDLRAYWAWALLRSGDLKKAGDAAAPLAGTQWTPIRDEIRLKSVIGESEQDLESFLGNIENRLDPEFLDRAADLTGSAELSLDAALLYMLSGRPDDAWNTVQAVMSGERTWNDPVTMMRMGVAQAFASIAQDNREIDAAIEWLSARVDENRRRRALSWENLQMLGDLHWERYLLTGLNTHRNEASEAWSEAIELLTADIVVPVPDDAWRLWVNQAVLEESAGRVRESRRLLEEALVLYPASQEVKSAWAMEMKDEEPALSRRLARSAYEESSDPVLGITAIRLDPDSISPRLYEARLWSLFGAVTDADENLHSSDSRTIATFLLNYMTSRRNYSSVDVAVDRYRKAYPDEAWVLTYRLAADASRGLAIIDLVSPDPAGMSAYGEMREAALAGLSWRALHDNALFAMIAAEELSEAVERFGNAPSRESGGQDMLIDAVILAILEPQARRPHIRDSPIGDRLSGLLASREDTAAVRKSFSGGGRKGVIARESAVAALEIEASRLRTDALDSLTRARGTATELEKSDMASILYLESLILNKLNRPDESGTKAREALELDPEHARARELLAFEDAS